MIMGEEGSKVHVRLFSYARNAVYVQELERKTIRTDASLGRADAVPTPASLSPTDAPPSSTFPPTATTPRPPSPSLDAERQRPVSSSSMRQHSEQPEDLHLFERLLFDLVSADQCSLLGSEQGGHDHIRSTEQAADTVVALATSTEQVAAVAGDSSLAAPDSEDSESTRRIHSRLQTEEAAGSLPASGPARGEGVAKDIPAQQLSSKLTEPIESTGSPSQVEREVVTGDTSTKKGLFGRFYRRQRGARTRGI
jgi:hypothetical protein